CIGALKRREELANVGTDPPWRREPQLVHVEGHRGQRAASTHSHPSGPTVAACGVPGSRSSRSPSVSGRSPSRAWNTIDPRRQKSTLWKSCACHPYVSPGPLPQERMAEHPSVANVPSACDLVADPS